MEKKKEEKEKCPLDSHSEEMIPTQKKVSFHSEKMEE